jgi:hypothetical protein
VREIRSVGDWFRQRQDAKEPSVAELRLEFRLGCIKIFQSAS